MKKYFFVFSSSLLIILLFNSRESYQIKISKNLLKPQERSHLIINKEKKERKERIRMGYPDKHTEIQKLMKTGFGKGGPTYEGGYQLKEFKKLQARNQNARQETEYFFIERGPGNISGRTRAFIVDASDASQNTWFAGAATGGVWKTINGGSSWEPYSTGLPNLGTNALAQSMSNPDVIFAGTGEQYGGGDINGSGLFKSTNHGQDWFQIISPDEIPAAQQIGRIIINPENTNEVVVSGTSSKWSQESVKSGIYKSLDGGISWSESLLLTNGDVVDMVLNDPTNWNIQYAAIAGRGVYKSTNGGQNWLGKSIGLPSNPGRIELGISPINSKIIWASEENGVLYVSKDGAESWSFVGELNSSQNFNFLIQGSYDNAVLAHPFDADKVYIGGVNLWEFTLTDSVKSVKNLELRKSNTEDFLAFIDFGGAQFGGIMDIGEVGLSRIENIELRFGQGTQKAHRFTVNGAGSGVNDSNYKYEDYVEVPFQVWDVNNDKQLMASFRDQQEDGKWNLIPANTTSESSLHSREYLFIHLIEYNESPNSNIAINGGQTFQQMYFFWPVGIENYTFDPFDLPISQIEIGFFNKQTIVRETFNISDAYNQFDGNNSLLNNKPANGENAVHPDHHSLHAININTSDQTFNLLSTNDGGIYLSKLSKQPGHEDMSFDFVSTGFNTTQFYAADKMPGEDRYIGGMQDQGTYLSPEEGSSNASSAYRYVIGGDGFEVLWNNRDPKKVIGSMYYNLFESSSDGGQTWNSASNGIGEDGPFLSRLANSRSYPDRIYAVGANGVYKSNNFGENWNLTPIESDYWLSSNYTDLEVSESNANIIWAANYMSETKRVFVSTDGGLTFTPTETYSEFPNMGPVIAINTHPKEDSTAFAQFAIDGLPKVLKTEDLGKTWVDITGFDPNEGSSHRGFPNTVVEGLICFPNDPRHMWVATDIGIVESMNGGESWNLINSNLPMVKILDMKIQDDQIIIATYGRGIWSVTIPEIEQEIVFAPNVVNVEIDLTGQTTLKLIYSDLFDSTHIFVDDEIVYSDQEQTMGPVNFTINNLNLNGKKSFHTVAYRDGSSYESIESEFLMYEVFDPQISYSTDFSNISEVAVDGFNIGYKPGFSDLALHSRHDYPASKELIAVLKTPIQVQETDATIEFKEIVIVETGQANTTYGDEEFWDYVILEGSTDGINWNPLLDGYDSDSDEEWLSAYNSQKNGDPSMYKERTINILDSFNPGDEILIRFRLFSDPGVQAWGWVIDDLVIQEAPLKIKKDEEVDWEIYPNPITDFININLKIKTKGLIKILDLQGKVIQTQLVAPETEAILFERGDLQAGIYLVSLESQGFNQIKKILVH